MNMSSMSDRVCQFFLRGRCQRENCEFRHDKAKAAKAGSNGGGGGGGGGNVCRFYQMGNCRFGDRCK